MGQGLAGQGCGHSAKGRATNKFQPAAVRLANARTHAHARTPSRAYVQGPAQGILSARSQVAMEAAHRGSCKGLGRRLCDYHGRANFGGRIIRLVCPCCSNPPSCLTCLQSVELAATPVAIPTAPPLAENEGEKKEEENEKEEEPEEGIPEEGVGRPEAGTHK